MPYIETEAFLSDAPNRRLKVKYVKISQRKNQGLLINGPQIIRRAFFVFANQLINRHCLNYYLKGLQRLPEPPVEAPEMTEDARPRPPRYFRRNFPPPLPPGCYVLHPALCQADGSCRAQSKREIVELWFLVPPDFPFFQARLTEIPEAAILNQKPGL